MALKWIPSIGGLIKTGKPGGSTCVTASKCRRLGQARRANRDGYRLPGDRVSGAGQRGQEPFDGTSAAWVGDQRDQFAVSPRHTAAMATTNRVVSSPFVNRLITNPVVRLLFTSFVTKRFASQTRLLTGLDLNPAGIEFCQKRHNLPGLDFVHGDAENLPIADQSSTRWSMSKPRTSTLTSLVSSPNTAAVDRGHWFSRRR
jgi:hypothetical protein